MYTWSVFFFLLDNKHNQLIIIAPRLNYLYVLVRVKIEIERYECTNYESQIGSYCKMKKEYGIDQFVEPHQSYNKNMLVLPLFLKLI